MRIYGHRGKRVEGEAYENTMEIFKKVMEEGADGIETDAIASLEGTIYLIHDEEISKHSEFDSGNIISLKDEEIDKKRVGRKTPYKIPKLQQLIELFRNKYPNKILNIEIKQKGIAKLVYEEVDKSKIDKEQIIISSFNHEDLREYRNLDKNIKIGILFESEEKGKGYLEYLKSLRKELGNAVYHPNINSPLLSELEGEKNIWTVKTKDLPKLEKLKDVNIFVDDFLKVKSAHKKES